MKEHKKEFTFDEIKRHNIFLIIERLGYLKVALDIIDVDPIFFDRGFLGSAVVIIVF
jgi:hypothetical protein